MGTQPDTARMKRAEVFDQFLPDVRPPRCVSKLGVDRPGILVSIAMVAVTD